jgi:cell division septation protein DedD
MTIKFRCECGRVLMASAEKAGQEGQCPACGQVMKIPEPETADMEKPEEGADTEKPEERAWGETPEDRVSEEPYGEREEAEEAPIGAEGMEDLEQDFEEEAERAPVKSSWHRSSRFGILASILVIVVVALVIFMFVRREKPPQEEVVVIQKMEPELVIEEETGIPAVGAQLEEEELIETPQFEEVEPPAPLMTEGETVEEISAQPPVTVGTEDAPAEEEPMEVASKPVEEQAADEVPPVEAVPEAAMIPPAGAWTINVASFREKQSAKQYVDELKQIGIDAFDWEVDLADKGRWYRVSVGGFSTRQEAETYVSELSQQGLSDMFITQIPGAS